MEFRTKISFNPSPLKADYNTPMLFIGSCFSDNVGRTLSDRKFPVLSNPFGVLYNPFSISLLLKRAIHTIPFGSDEVFEQEGVSKSFLFHSSFAHTNKDLFIKKANESLTTTRDFLTKANFLFITLGTARYYKYKATGEIVANCHKRPSGEFSSVLAEASECAQELSGLIDEIRKVNSDIFVVFTISPVRHFKDGAFGNQVSKSTLFCAVNSLLKKVENSYYFPAFELVMDELRDYRFYNEDMVHPSDLAVEYIIERFEEALLTSESIQLSARIKSMLNALRHRPLFPESESYRKFVEGCFREVNQLQNEHPQISFEEELNVLKNKA